MRSLTDFYAKNEGTIILLIPNTPRAGRWIDKNVQVEPYQRMGHNIAIDHGMFSPIATGIEEHGMKLEEV